MKTRIPRTHDGDSGRVTFRAVAIALLLAVVNDYWLVQLEIVRYSYPTYAAPFYNCIFILLLLTAANHLLRRWRGRSSNAEHRTSNVERRTPATNHRPPITNHRTPATNHRPPTTDHRFRITPLTQIELITIYVMLSIISGICSLNMMSFIVSSMGYASFFKTPENKWGELFIHLLPKWLTVSDQGSLKNFYSGASTLYDPANFMPWVVPVLWWSVFGAVMLFTTLCINSIVRKQWVESERLTFPIIMLPLEMTDDSGSLFRNKHMWMGFGIAAVITLMAGLNALYPSVPHLQIVRRNIGYLVTSPPWNAMGGIQMGFYLWAIGIAFLMPLELSFSCWFFFWLGRLEMVGSRWLGFNELTVIGGGFDRAYPFLNSQAFGAYVGFFAMSMWTARRYLARVFRTAFLGTREEDESREGTSYRTAILGALAGALFMCGFAVRMGMAIWAAAAFFVLYLGLVIIISRIRAEVGFPVHDMNPMGPQFPLQTALGTQNIPAGSLAAISLFAWINKSHASHPGPHQLESYKLSERTGASARGMFRAALIAGMIAMPLGFWMFLHVYFRNGGATANMGMWALGHGRDTWNELAVWLKQPSPPNKIATAFVGVGFTISMLLYWLRIRFLSFPFHPLAYALGPSWGVAQLWMPLMIGSTAKFVILRFGGLSLYRRALPFFFGLILGEITVGSLWTILGIVLGIPTYDFWPGKYQ